MIVLTLEPGEAEKLAQGAPGLQRKYGMPIDPAPYPRTASSEPACRAVVAARLNAPELGFAAAAAPRPNDGRRAARRPRADRGRCLRRRPRSRRVWPAGAQAMPSRKNCRPTSPRRAPPQRPPAPSTTSSAARASSGATRRRATSWYAIPAVPRSPCRDSIRSKPMKRRSQTSPPSSRGGRSPDRRGTARLGRRAACDDRGRGCRAARSDRRPCRAEPRGAAAGGRRGFLLDAGR